jgi:hypothetical protein
MWTLHACTCPRFDEMEVVGDDSDVVLRVEQALGDFAAWTGREGVCVPEIQIVDDIEEPAEADPEVVFVGGAYAGPHMPIRVVAADVRPSVFHELCHALDREEDHAASASFPPPQFAELYPDTHVDREAFAQACDDGPSGVAYDALLADRCGITMRWSEADLYVDTEVYPAMQPTFGEDLAWSKSTMAWSGVSADVEIVDAARLGDEVVVLTVTPDEEEPTIYVFDATLTTQHFALVVGPSPFGRSGPRGGYTRVELVPSDVGAWFLAEVPYDVHRWRTWTEPEEGELSDVPNYRTLTTSDDQLYLQTGTRWFGYDLEPLLGDWVQQPAQPASPVSRLAWPSAAGLTADGPAGRWRLSAGAWSREPSLPLIDRRVELGEGRALVRSTWERPRILHDEGGTFRFVGDPCAPTPAWVLEPLAAAPGGVWAFPPSDGVTRTVRWIAIEG